MADEPKIIVDEDWKTQVEREREQARAAVSGDKEKKPEKGAEEAEPDPHLLSLITNVATQTLLALGMFGSPESGEVVVDIEQAKFLVDTLIMLREKTKGNLAAAEQNHLTQAIAELQRAYVARAQQVQEATLKQSGLGPKQPGK